MIRPTYRSAYLVQLEPEGPYIGVVRRDGPFWRFLRFGVFDEEQSDAVFASRDAAASKLVESASSAS